MESRHQTTSVMARLMGLDKVPPQHPIGEKQRVLSEKYLQKVASIGLRRKRPSHQHNSLTMNIEEKEDFREVLEGSKKIQKNENHKLSTENGMVSPDTLETGNLQLFQKISCGPPRDFHAEIGLYEALRLPKSQLESRDGTSPPTSIVLKPNARKVESSLKCFSLPSSCENCHLSNGQLRDFSSPKIATIYPGMKEKKKLAGHAESIKQNPRAFCKVSEEVSSQRRDDTKRVLDRVSVSLFRGNETNGGNSEMMGPVRNDDPRTRTKNGIHKKHWGLRQPLDAYSNSSPHESKKQNLNKKDCLKHLNLRSISEKAMSSLFISLDKLKKNFYETGSSDQNPLVSKLSISLPSLTCGDNQNIQQKCLMKDEAKSNKLQQRTISEQNTASPNSTINGQVADEKFEVVKRPCGNPNCQLSESTSCILFGESDFSNHASYTSIQQETSEFQEGDSVYSFSSDTKPGSLGSIEEAFECSPISVLEPTFREDTLFSSECLKVAGDDLSDSSEMDDEELGLNVSSDEDCGDRSADYEEKKDFVAFLRAEESRDFSYVIDVLTEAGISNASLYTDFCTWHSPQYPISLSIFENLEMKFGKQPSWKRSDRRLLFDRINSALLEILEPCMCIPTWEKPVSRRLNAESSHDMIEEELWELLLLQEKEAKKESPDKMLVGEKIWIELRYDIEDIVGEIVSFLIEELALEII